MNISRLVHKTLTPRIAPMVYIMMAVSIFIGFSFGLNVLVGTQESILYNSGVLVHRQAWGAALFVTATLAELGFWLKNDTLIRVGGMWGFMLWLFASIALIQDSNWYILISVALLHLLFHGYVVLASSLGYLERKPL